MAFLAPLAAALGGKVFDKIFNFDKGGQVNVDRGKKALVMIHHGEMVVPKKDVEKTKRAMKKEGVSVPRERMVKHGVVGKGGRIKK